MEQYFNVTLASSISEMLLLAVLSLTVPSAAQRLTSTTPSGIKLQSRGSAVVLLVSYVLYLFFSTGIPGISGPFRADGLCTYVVYPYFIWCYQDLPLLITCSESSASAYRSSYTEKYIYYTSSTPCSASFTSKFWRRFKEILSEKCPAWFNLEFLFLSLPFPFSLSLYDLS